MQVQTMNEIIQVKTRVCDTYCSHHRFSSLIALALKKKERQRKVNMHCTRLKFCLIYILGIYDRSFLYEIELIIR